MGLITAEEIIAKQFIKEKDRSAFGRGYEHRRLKRPLDENPFPLDSFLWHQFRDGFNARRQYELAPKKIDAN